MTVSPILAAADVGNKKATNMAKEAAKANLQKNGRIMVLINLLTCLKNKKKQRSNL